MRHVQRGVCGADLSALAYVFVKADGSDAEKIKVQGTATAIDSVGVLLPGSAGDDGECLFVYCGIATVKAAATLEPFDLVTADASGHAVKATQNDAVLGQVMPASGTGDAADDDEIQIWVFANKTVLLA